MRGCKTLKMLMPIASLDRYLVELEINEFRAKPGRIPAVVLSPAIIIIEPQTRELSWQIGQKVESLWSIIPVEKGSWLRAFHVCALTNQKYSQTNLWFNHVAIRLFSALLSELTV
jgi:hypothetical protein